MRAWATSGAPPITISATMVSSQETERVRPFINDLLGVEDRRSGRGPETAPVTAVQAIEYLLLQSYSPAMNFTLRELEAFLGVARLGNFTRAAKALHMSQPALTVRIRHLEDALGVRLLDRTTRSVALTQIGREFLPVVARVLGEIDAVSVNARDVAGRRRGVVTVAALPSVAATLLPGLIAP